MPKFESARRPGPEKAAPSSAKASPEKPAPGVSASPDGLDWETRLDRAERLGHRFGQYAISRDRSAEPRPDPPRQTALPSGNAEAPIQGAFTDRLRRWFGLSRGGGREVDDQTPLRPMGRSGPIGEMALERDQPLAERSMETPAAAKVSTASTVLSGLSTAVGKPAHLLGTLGAAGQVSAGAGAFGGPVGAAGSLVDAGLAAHQIATGSDTRGDKALLGLQAGSALGSAVTSSASGAISAAMLHGGDVASTAANVAGPAALATGVFDVARGGVGAWVAGQRQGELESLEGRGGRDAGLARFAAESQKTKKWSGIGTALKGGLGIAGGAALLAGAGPVGWGLLGGAAAVGLGVAGYQAYRKHSQGKQLLDQESGYSQQLQAAGIQIPTDRELSAQPWYKRMFATRSMRAHDLIRGQVAARLKQGAGEGRGNLSPEILRLLGLKEEAEGSEIARALG
jgi:hypothetical protein